MLTDITETKPVALGGSMVGVVVPPLLVPEVVPVVVPLVVPDVVPLVVPAAVPPPPPLLLLQAAPPRARVAADPARVKSLSKFCLVTGTPLEWEVGHTRGGASRLTLAYSWVK
jgi:hypothetical protein